jgi:hypothetical protein
MTTGVVSGKKSIKKTVGSPKCFDNIPKKHVMLSKCVNNQWCFLVCIFVKALAVLEAIIPQKSLKHPDEIVKIFPL